MVCSVPYFVVQAVSYCVIKHVTSGPVTIRLLSAAGFFGENSIYAQLHYSSERQSHLRLFLLNHIVFVEDRSILCIIYIVFGR